MDFGVGIRNGVGVFGVMPMSHFRGSRSSQPISATAELKSTVEEMQPLVVCEEKRLERQICGAMRL